MLGPTGFQSGKLACEIFHKPLNSTSEMVDNREPAPRSPAEQQDIARRRDALLAAARGETPKGGSGGGNLAGIGMQFAGVLLLCLAAGWFFDKKFESSPWGTLGGMMLGLGVGLYAMIRAANAEQKREEGGK